MQDDIENIYLPCISCQLSLEMARKSLAAMTGQKRYDVSFQTASIYLIYIYIYICFGTSTCSGFLLGKITNTQPQCRTKTNAPMPLICCPHFAMPDD